MFFNFFKAYDDSLLQASIKYGPLSKEAENKLHALDEQVGKLLHRLKTTTMDTMVKILMNFYGSNEHLLIQSRVRQSHN